MEQNTSHDLKTNLMSKDRPVHPPEWAQRLLEFYCRPELLEDLQGDLHEFFERNVETKGARKARLIYIIDVIKFFRLYTIRKPVIKNPLNQPNMVGSYVKSSGRSIIRSKLFSGINIIGLAISMSVGLLVITFLTDLLSFDDFHKKKDRIYRVLTADQHTGAPPMRLASTSLKAGKKLQQTIPGVEDLTVFRRGFGGDATVNETTVPFSGLWADESFFKVFSFPLLRGDAVTALQKPNSLVLTESSAKKLFGNTDPVNKIVKFDTTSYIVTGVLKDIPKFSYLRFEALVSYSSIDLTRVDADGGHMDWGNIYSNYVYFVLAENTKLQSVQAGIDKLCAEENVALDNRKIALSLQPLQKVSIGTGLGNEMGPTINSVAIWILLGLAIVIILSACFNYTNLSIARSLRRSREVGIRKVIGALKMHVWGQFITESIIISLLALVFSFFLFLFLRTQFLSLNPFLQSIASLELSPKIVLYFIGFAIVVGLLAGFIPALFYSRINAIQVLKDASTLKVFRHINLRKALIVVQYCFSLIFITTTFIGHDQYKGFLSYDLGFTTENIVNIRLQLNKDSLLIKELSAIPEIKGISRSRMVASLGSIHGMQMKYKDPMDSGVIFLNFVDEHFLPMHNYTLLAGKNFTPVKGDEAEVIVNQQLLRRFNISPDNPEKALGEIVDLDGKKLPIVGVLKDFHYGTLEDKIQPTMLRYSAKEPFGYVNVKVATKDWTATRAKIEAAWTKIDKIHPLDAKFYDDAIEEAYSQFSVIVKVIGFFSFLAICIASLGLLGMAVYTTEKRLKEISIRKVLGASEGKLIFLLSKGFLSLLMLAAFIAIPATWLFFEKVVLVKFAYHQPISIVSLFSGLFIVMGLAFLMVTSQTFKAARSNPASILKQE